MQRNNWKYGRNMTRVDKIRMKLSVVYIKGSRVEMSK